MNNSATPENNIFVLPNAGWRGLRQHWRSDAFAAFLVSWLAFPFWISIAWASQAPIWSGVIGVIAASIVASHVRSSYLTIQGATLVLMPVVIYAIQYLGSGYPDTGFYYLLTCTLAAGIAQVLWGSLRGGNLLEIIPEAVLYGLLAMTGVHVILICLPHLIGTSPQDYSRLGLLLDMPSWLYQGHLETALVGLFSFGLLIGFSVIKSRLVPIIPSSLLVILLGSALGWYLELPHTLRRATLTQLPTYDVQGWGIMPDISRLGSLMAIDVCVSIFLLSSLITMLNIRNIDGIDFYRRKSQINRELIAVGICNVLVSFLGGLPVITGLEFSSANVNSRAKTRWSGVFFACWTAIFALPLWWYGLPPVPLTCLAAVVIFQAYKLCAPSLIRSVGQVGKEQLFAFGLSFVVSFVLGVVAGLVVGMIGYAVIFMYLGVSWRNLFILQTKTVNFGNNRNKITLRSPALFSNYLALRREIAKLPPDSQIYIDFTKSPIIDHNFMELVYHHPYNYNTTAGDIELQGLEIHDKLSPHPLSTRILKQKSKFQEDIALYNERQLEVLAVASIHNAKLRPHLTYDGNKLQGFRFALGYEIKYRENKFTKNYKSYTHAHLTKIEFSDVFLSKGIRLSEQSYHVSVLLISNIRAYVPAFTLIREGLLARVLQTVGYEDINFAEHQQFSEYYFLRGNREEEVRAFFNPSLLHFLMENSEYNIESSDNRLLIYQDLRPLNRLEIEDALAFVEQLLRIMYQEQETEEATQNTE